MKLDSTISAVVTGGASGLGEGTARAIAATGAKVALFDLNAEKGEAIAASPFYLNYRKNFTGFTRLRRINRIKTKKNITT